MMENQTAFDDLKDMRRLLLKWSISGRHKTHPKEYAALKERECNLFKIYWEKEETVYVH